MNKRLLLFAVALLCLSALRYAFGQGEPVIGWDSVLQDDPIQDVAAVMLAAQILGGICGAFRLFRTKLSAAGVVVLTLALNRRGGLHDTNENSCFRPPENSGSAGRRFMPA